MSSANALVNHASSNGNLSRPESMVFPLAVYLPKARAAPRRRHY